MPFPEVMWWHCGRTINPSVTFHICLNQTDKKICKCDFEQRKPHVTDLTSKKAVGIEKRDWRDIDICLKAGLSLEDI